METGRVKLLSTENIEIAEIFRRIFEEEPEKVEKWLRWADTALKLLAKEIPIQHINAQDIVHAIVTKAIFDDRSWDIGSLPVNVFMYNTIKSEVSNFKQKEKNRIYARINDEDENDEDSENQLLDRDQAAKDDFNLAVQIENIELLELCAKSIEDDYDCAVVFEAMKEVDPGKNKQIAEITGFSVSKVENIKKVLFRKLNKVLSNYKY